MDMPRYKKVTLDHATPIVLGHEFSGEVIEVGPKVTAAKVGDRIYGLTFRPCGRCEPCKAGDFENCRFYPESTEGNYINGAMAEYMFFPYVIGNKLVKLPPDLTYRDGSLLEPLCLSIGLAQKAKKGDVVVIIGQDIMGLGIVAYLKEKGIAKKIIVSDVSKKRLEAAKELGADVVVNELNEDLYEVVAEATGHDKAEKLQGGGADVVIETSGRNVNFYMTIDVVKPRGQIWLATFYDEGPFMFDPSKQVAGRPRSNFSQKGGAPMQCAWGTLGPWVPRLEESIKMIQSGKLNAAKYVDHVFPLDKVMEAFETAIDPHKSIKVVLEP
jgi:threonine dehydrogenase-like Zn-dependent dehydrogenase